MRCDLFCAVIDNHGDLGVCWRLARQLHHEHGVAVRLWVDDLAAFAFMAPELDPRRDQQWLGGVDIRRWHDHLPADPGDLVVEGFGCRPPAHFLAAMAAKAQPPCWLNLEYLSAEAWVADCHGMTSVHPRTGLVQHFWFPGFVPRTGGLLREADLEHQRQDFQSDASARQAFWHRLGVPDADRHGRRLSLFAYDNPAIAGLLQALADDPTPSLLLVPVSRALAQVSAWAGEALQAGDRRQFGRLQLVVLPFLSHADYDRLLWACDLNLVRGEDSWVRAHWAQRPFLWQIYPQADRAHAAKLEAFLAAVATVAAPSSCWVDALRDWNQLGTGRTDWPGLLDRLPTIAAPLQAWTRQLLAQPDLAAQMMRFCANRVESPPDTDHTGNTPA